MSAAPNRPEQRVGAVQFLDTLFGAAPRDEWVTIFANAEGRKVIRWAKTGELAPTALAAANIDGDVWYGVATRRERLAQGRGSAEHCGHLPALWVDIDIRTEGAHAADDLPVDREEAWTLIGDMPLPPTVVVDSGNGLQPYWLLDEPLPVSQAGDLLARWGATWMQHAHSRGWHLDNVFDIARVMRVPGTWNHKSDPPRSVDVIHAQHRRYSVDDLDGYLLDVPTPAVAHPPRTVPYIGPERPGDAFNATTDPAVLLERVGCVEDRVDPSGDRHYRAPHRAEQWGATGVTVYAVDRHVTIYSETFARTWQMVTQRPYDAFGLYTHIFHAGDWRAATTALSAAGYGTDTVNVAALAFTPTPAASPERMLDLAHLVDWGPFWLADHAEEEWAAYPVLPKGRSVALFAEAKVGKSSIILAAVAALATGQPIYGQTVTEPVHVLYLDYEMGAADLMERMSQLGYGPDTDLSHLHYALLPSLPPLDTAEGAAAVVELVTRTGSEVVVVDTFGRAVQGEENEADTVRAYYRHTGSALKRLNVTQARLDHAGKDAAKGQRGSSAKADDVDVVWRARRTDDGAELIRTHSRPSWVPERVELIRTESEDEQIRWRLSADRGYPAGTSEMVQRLERLGVPADASVRKAAGMLRDAGEGGRNKVVGAAQRARKNLWTTSLEVSPDSPDTYIRSIAEPGMGDTSNTPSDLRETFPETGGNTDRPERVTVCPSKRGTHTVTGTPSDPANDASGLF